MQAIVGDTDVTTHQSQGGTGRIDNLAALVDRAQHLAHKVLPLGDHLGQCGEERHGLLVSQYGGLQRLGNLLSRGDAEKLVGVEDAAERGLLQRAARIGGAEQVQRRANAAEADRLAQQALPAQDLVEVRRRAQLQGKVMAARKGCELRKPRQDLVVLKDT